MASRSPSQKLIIPKIVHIKYHLVSLTGACVEYGWAAGEAVIIPHLLNPPILLSPTAAGFIFLVNPVFGICLQPLVGNASDSCESKVWGKRKPFVFLFGAVAVAGLLVLVFYTDWHLARMAQIVVCFTAFGCMDLAHDILLIPGRSMLLDMVLSLLPSKDKLDDYKSFTDEEIKEIEKDLESQADNMYTLYQLIGRFLALLVGSFNLNFKGYFNHYQSLLLSSAVFLIFACGTALIFGVDEDFKYSKNGEDEDGNDNENNYQLLRSSEAAITRTTSMAEDGNDNENNYQQLRSSEGAIIRTTSMAEEDQVNDLSSNLDWYDHTRNELDTNDNNYDNNNSIVDTESYSIHNHSEEKRNLKYYIFPLVLLLLLQFLGWVLLCNACFWWTAWIGIDTIFETTGLRTALVTFAIQTFSGLLYTVYGYRFFTRIFGIKKVWFVCEISYCILMIAFWFVGPNEPLILCGLMFLTGAMFSVHNTAIYSLIRDVVGHDKVAWATALCNNTLPAAQIFVSVSSGYFIGDCLITSPQCLAVGTLFFWSGSICLVLTLLIVIIDSVFKVLPNV